MKKLDEQIREEFEKIELSYDKSVMIRENIIKKYEIYRKTRKTILTISTAILIGLISIGVVYADEIQKIVQGFTVTTTIKDNGKINIHGEVISVKEVNYDANIKEISCESQGEDYTISELESLLNINILKSDYFKKDKFSQILTKREQGKIASATFVLENFTGIKQIRNKNTDRFDMNISFVTKYAKDENNLLGWGSGEDFYIKEHFLKKLNTNAYILVSQNEQDENFNIYKAYFLYDNIVYSFVFRFGQSDRTKYDLGYSWRLEIKNRILEEELQKIKNILDSLKY